MPACVHAHACMLARHGGEAALFGMCPSGMVPSHMSVNLMLVPTPVQLSTKLKQATQV